MGIIKQLKSKLGEQWFPITKTRAVYDDSNVPLQNYMDAMVLAEGSSVDSVPVIVDADRLGGQLPAYYTPQALFDERIAHYDTGGVGRTGLCQNCKWDTVALKYKIIDNARQATLIQANSGGAIYAYVSKSVDASGYITWVGASILPKDTIRNRNILDNWDFTNPVNQRGQTTYTGITSHTYCIDRWFSQTPWGTVPMNVTLASDGLTFSGIALPAQPNATGILLQAIENASKYAGKTFTMSIDVAAVSATAEGYWPYIVAYGASWSYLGSVQISATGITSYTINVPVGTTELYFGISLAAGATTVGSIKIKGVKFELGSVSTLANDPPADYKEELLKCQRYYLAVKMYTRIYGGTGGTFASFNMPTPVTMRGLPSIIGTATFVVYDNGTLRTVTLSNDGALYNNGVGFILNATFSTNYSIVGYANVAFGLSADL